jgi:hypothetical protein
MMTRLKHYSALDMFLKYHSFWTGVGKPSIIPILTLALEN